MPRKPKGELTISQQIEKGLVDRVEGAKDVSALAGIGFDVGRDLGSMLHHVAGVFDSDAPFIERVETGMKAAAALAATLATTVEQMARLSRQSKKRQQEKTKAE